MIGNKFSEADIKTQLGNAELMFRGVDDLKQALRETTLEAIGVFKSLEQQGLDLSKYEL